MDDASAHDDERGPVVTCRVPARVGLVGNPSDGFGGAVLATVVPGLAATVRARPAAGVLLGPAPVERSSAQPMSAAAWWDHAAAHGHGDEQRIIGAALWTVMRHLGVRHGIDLRWSTTVPRSVGLAGSSALAVATIDAACGVWGVALDRRVVAALALAAEVDVLGIAAGWQDRIVQAFDATVLVDTASMASIDGVDVPAVEVVRPGAPIRLVVGWSEQTASPSDGYHAALRTSPHRLAAAMRDLAALAHAAADSVRTGDRDALAAAVDAGWRTRQAAAPLRVDHAALVDAVRAVGVGATTPGSGGSVVAVPLDDDDERRVFDALRAGGIPAYVVTVE